MIRSQLLLLILILLIGFFFRTYKIVERFEFAHDGDLYSWIVKDILVNGHLRLIGQETSASGIFIGPMFYYLLIPFFLITNMDPIGALVPVTIIGTVTILSYFFVFFKLFNINAGLIASFLHAVLLTNAGLDRWVVPTNPTNLWAIWYFYTLIMLSRGKFFILPLLGVLTGLIWHIHIALIPALTAIPFAVFASKKLPNSNQIIKSAIAFFVLSIPLIMFETRHNFQQTISILNNFIIPKEGASGLYKLQLVLGVIVKNVNSLFFAPASFGVANKFFTFAILSTGIFLVKKKVLSFGELVPLYAWVLGVILFFSLSKSPVSEYYFSNIGIVFLSIVSLFLYWLVKTYSWGRQVVVILLFIILAKNVFFLLTDNYYNKGYLERKDVVNYIVSDAKTKNFPCFSINYITAIGENVGFRYFFYLKNAHIAVPGRGSPVYSIVIPDEYALNEVEAKFGHIGIIPPKEIPARELITDACSGANTNLTDPMLGYVE